MEVETDKALVEIEAPATGILANVSAVVGDEVPVGQAIAVILAPGEAPTERLSPVSPTAPTPDILPLQVPPSTMPIEGETRRIPASPAARRLAKEKGIDLASLTGTGAEGAIVAQDVLAAEGQTSPPAGAVPRIREIVPLSAMRRIIAERMTRSKQTAAHFYVGMDVDMTGVDKRRAEAKEKRYEVVPSINDLILWACAYALRDFPSLNSTLTDQGVQILSDINIGMVVAIEDGLVAPVIRNADRLNLEQLATQREELVEKAQRKNLFPLDYEGGTFTVSNLGMFGVDRFVAIINPPQCAILAVGQVAPRAVPHGNGIGVRSMMTMTLSADHRIVDGVIAARFLQEVKALLEGPGSGNVV
jgi:pyruvate dehydrogenase E2 component (dihydrolipoamide acetyltransferase)